jgi:hypothetical protein
MTTVFKLRGNTGDEIVDITYVSDAGPMSLVKSKRLSRSWEEYNIPARADTLEITFQNDKYIPGSYDRNVYLDVGSIKHTGGDGTYAIAPVIRMLGLADDARPVINNAIKRGIFVANGTYVIDLTDLRGSSAGAAAIFKDPGSDFNPEPPQVSQVSESSQRPWPMESNMMILVVVIVVLICSSSAAMMMMMMRM